MSGTPDTSVLRTRKPRARRLFGQSGRTLLVAMDHLSRPERGTACRDPARVLAEVQAAGADGVLLRPGPAARLAPRLGSLALVVSLIRDLPITDHSLDLSMRLGADAVKTEVFPGADDAAQWAGAEALAARCDARGMPLVIESIPFSFAARERHTPDNLRAAARLAADLGADVVKTRYTGDPETLAELVSFAATPVVVLGGSSGSVEDLLTMVRAALDSGAIGAAIGRRIWASDRPGAMAGALSRLIHEDASVDVAVAEATRTVVGASARGTGSAGSGVGREG